MDFPYGKRLRIFVQEKEQHLRQRTTQQRTEASLLHEKVPKLSLRL